MIFVDSFSGDAADLKGTKRTHANVLAALRKCPRLSCFDLSEHRWLDIIVRDLRKQGAIELDTDPGYPWVAYKVRAER